MARQNRCPEGLDYKRNRIGLRLVFIFILALITNIALSSSKPTQNVRFKRDNDEEEYHTLDNFTGDSDGSTMRVEMNTEKVQGDTKTNTNKKSSNYDYEDFDTNNAQSEEPGLDESSNMTSNITANTSTTDVTSPTSHPDQEEDTTKNDGGDGDADADDENNDDEIVEDADDYDTTSGISITSPPGKIPLLVKANTPLKKEEISSTEAGMNGMKDTVSTETSKRLLPDSPILDDNTSPKTTNHSSIEEKKSQDSASFRLSNMATLTISIMVLHLSRI